MACLPSSWTPYKCDLVLRSRRGPPSFARDANRRFNELVGHDDISAMADLGYGLDEVGSMHRRLDASDGRPVVVVTLAVPYDLEFAAVLEPASRKCLGRDECANGARPGGVCDVDARHGPVSACFYCLLRSHVPRLRGFKRIVMARDVPGAWARKELELVFACA